MKQLDIFSLLNQQKESPVATSTGDFIIAVNDILPGTFGNGILDIFKMMEYAEDEIKIAQAKYQDHAQELFDSFYPICSPSRVFVNEYAGIENLYRRHVKELLLRVINGEDTRPPTRIEKMILLCEMSLRQPLRSTTCLLYSRLMKQEFGYVPYDESDPLYQFREEYPGECDELDHDLVRKLTVDERIHAYKTQKTKEN